MPAQALLEHGEQTRAENSRCEAGRRVRPSGSAQDPLPVLPCQSLAGKPEAGARIPASLTPRGRAGQAMLRPAPTASRISPASKPTGWLQTPQRRARGSEQPQGRDAK